MSKKMMLLALAVACAAVFALPATASAQTAHISATTSFSLTGAGGTLTSAAGSNSNVVCTGTAGSGTFVTTTIGSITIQFSGCKISGFDCSNTATAGRIEVTNSFQAIMASAGTSTGNLGILLLPTGSSTLTGGYLFTEFTCIGVLTISVYGDGVIGTIEEACNTNSTTFRLNFESNSTGVQKDLQWTGKPYLLFNNMGGHPMFSLDARVTMTFPAARQLHCT